MPKRIAPLTDAKIRTIKITEKPQKLFDGGGLFLLVTPSGGKLWRFKYRFDEKEKVLALGAYPDLSLTGARSRREQARTLLANGVDPGNIKKAQAAANTYDTETFEVIAREWHTRNLRTWAVSHSSKIIRRLELYIFPWMGARPIKEITAPEMLAVLRRIEAKGAIETARRAHQVCGQVFRFRELRIWWTIQSFTSVFGKIASMASGKPLRPSTQAIRISFTPLLERSVST